MSTVEEGSISRAALHVLADAIRLQDSSELTDSERTKVARAIRLLVAVSDSTEKRVPFPASADVSAAIAPRTEGES